jgi:hypothetical protein
MRGASWSSAVVLAACTVFGAASAAADPIPIREGGVGFDTGDPPGLRLVGDGFSLQSLFPTLGAFQLCTTGCVPGDLITPTTVFGAPTLGFGLGTGFATVNGTTYGTAIAGPNSVVFRGTLAFDAAPVVIPSPPAEGFLRVMSPFALTGSVSGFATFEATDPLFTMDVRGSGITTLILERRLDDPSGAYFFRAVQYDIVDPVPEPATLLLCASGLAGLLIRRRRHTGRVEP